MNSDASSNTPRKTIKLSGSFGKHHEIADAVELIEYLQRDLAAEQYGSEEWYAVNAELKQAEAAHAKLIRSLRNS